jgi:hypothetical protein
LRNIGLYKERIEEQRALNEWQEEDRALKEWQEEDRVKCEL